MRLAPFLFGMFLCWTVRCTDNLWFAVGTHTAWNCCLAFVYSAPDSGYVAEGHLLSSSLKGSRWLTGGSFGPEGSVFSFVVIICLLLAFNRFFPAKGHGPRT